MTPLWLILGIIGAATLLLVLNHDSGTSLGMANEEFGQLVFFVVWGAVVAAAILPRRGQWREAARNAVLWLTIILVLVAAYLYRYEVQDIGARLGGGLIPGSPVSETGADGRARITLIRASDGHFHARGKANGTTVSFLIDTGASVVVLTQADARRAGIDTAALSYSVPVTTANGTATAARVTLDSLAVGEIARERVPALVTRRGALDTSLLSMSYVSTLWGFEIRGDRLILTD